MPRKSARTQPEFVHQFLVVLSGTDPLVWRRIQVPLACSFWDLHVAIQDSMGWLDYHLHEFRVLDAKNKLASIADPSHPEHESMLTWAGGSYDPDSFNPATVVFEDPRKRWKIAFA